jgi:hypothetical protein
MTTAKRGSAARAQVRIDGLEQRVDKVARVVQSLIVLQAANDGNVRVNHPDGSGKAITLNELLAVKF